MKNKIRYYTIKNNFLAIEKEFSDYKNSKIVLLPVPFEDTTSYGKGTAAGPKAILDASHYVEFFDEELNRELCFEKGNGICSLHPVEFKGKKGKKALDLIYENVKKHIDNKKFVVTLGGEHSISTAPVKAHYDSYKNLSVLHFVAHCDLRQEYDASKYSRASCSAGVAALTTERT